MLGSSSGSCPVTIFGTSDEESLGSTVRELVKFH
jgi:hypothetical protein